MTIDKSSERTTARRRDSKIAPPTKAPSRSGPTTHPFSRVQDDLGRRLRNSGRFSPHDFENRPIQVRPMRRVRPPQRTRGADLRTGVPQDAVSAQPQRAFDISLARLFVWCGYLVGAVVAAICALDLAVGWPFETVQPLFDVGHFLCAAMLLYLSHNSHREC